MSRRKPKPSRAAAPLAIEHAQPPRQDPTAPPLGTQLTGWHYLLVQALQKLRSAALDVHGFVKLGTLLLEADVILLQLRQDAELTEFARYFGFLVPLLRSYLLIEYKGPHDRLTIEDFDTVLSYARLCKRKYGFWQDQELAVAMLYSATESEFFARCAHNGFAFVPTQPGVRSFCEHAIHYHAVDLVTVGEQQPAHPINLLSARRRSFAATGPIETLGPFAVLYEEIFLKEIKKMSQLQVPGSGEILDDAERLIEQMMLYAGVERRLRGLAPEEILTHLSPEDRLRGLAPEDRLRGLTPKDRLRGLAPEDRLRGLTPAERAHLRKLLMKDEGR